MKESKDRLAFARSGRLPERQVKSTCDRLRISLANVKEMFGLCLDGIDFKYVDKGGETVGYYFAYKQGAYEYPITAVVNIHNAIVQFITKISGLPHPERITSDKLGRVKGKHGWYDVMVRGRTFTLKSSQILGGEMTCYTIDGCLSDVAEISEPLLDVSAVRRRYQLSENANKGQMIDDESEMTDDRFEEYDEDEDFEHDPEQIAKFLIFGPGLPRSIDEMRQLQNLGPEVTRDA